MSTHQHEANDPQTIRLISINDPHWTTSNPPSFKTSYLNHLEGNIGQILTYAEKIKADATIWGGDTFHLKEPRNTPHHLVTKVMEHMQRTLSLGIAGNHDVRYGSTETGLQGSPLEVLIKAGAFHLLDQEEHLFAGVPGLNVKVAGASYHHGRADAILTKTKGSGVSHLVTVGHFWLGTQTGTFFGEPLYGFNYFKDCDSDVIIVGHHHEDKGVIVVGGKTFVSPGSISITGAHPHDLLRRPAATLIEISMGFGQAVIKTTILRPKCLPASELLDLERHEEVRQEKREMDEFIQSLTTTEITAMDPRTVLEEIAQSEEVKKRALAYLEKAETKEKV